MKIDHSVIETTAFEPQKITNAATSNDQKLRDQTDAFEAFLVKKILDISLKRENALFGKDAGDKIYNSMYNDTMSKALSGGLGYSELLFNFLKEAQTDIQNGVHSAPKITAADESSSANLQTNTIEKIN